MALLINLFLAISLGAITFAMHFFGLVGLSWVMRRRYMVNAPHSGDLISQGITIILIVTGLFLLHGAQMMLYAVTYILLGQFNELEPALYFSASTFTTVGFGDIVLSEQWRMLAAAESANGFLLIGWSTAFLVALTARVRAFEADIEGAQSDDASTV